MLALALSASPDQPDGAQLATPRSGGRETARRDRRPSTVPRLISRTPMHAAHETLQPRHHVRSNNGMPLGISHKRIMPNHFPGLTPWLLVLGYIKDALPPAGGTLSFSLFPSPCPAASFLFISLCDLRPPQHRQARWSTIQMQSSYPMMKKHEISSKAAHNL